MSRAWAPVAVLAAVLMIAWPAVAQQPIQYIYDDLGRLVGVVDPAADTAVYSRTSGLFAPTRQSSS